MMSILWYTVAMDNDDEELRVNRKELSVVDLDDSSDDQYWWSRTPEERLQAMEIYRRIVYGYGSTPPRFQRVLEVARR